MASGWTLSGGARLIRALWVGACPCTGHGGTGTPDSG